MRIKALHKPVPTSRQITKLDKGNWIFDMIQMTKNPAKM